MINKNLAWWIFPFAFIIFSGLTISLFLQNSFWWIVSGIFTFLMIIGIVILIIDKFQKRRLEKINKITFPKKPRDKK